MEPSAIFARRRFENHPAWEFEMVGRPSVLLFSLLLSMTAVPCQAGRFCDWLFGRNQAYVANYAPVAVSPVVAVSQPVVVAQQPLLSTGAAPIPATLNGSFQAQRVAYDNPSVYTGLPVTTVPGNAQASYRLPTTPLTTAAPALLPTAPVVPLTNQYLQSPINNAYRPVLNAAQNTVPLARRIRGVAPRSTTSPFYGTGNIYPTNLQAPGYAAAYPGTTLVTPGSPATVSIAPQPSGLARFFGSRWRTGYRSNYYRAPITYYTPVTNVDPTTGQLVTVQQPCTSYVQQLQRTPFAAPLAPANPLIPAPAAAPLQTPLATSPAPAFAPQNTLPLTGMPPQNGIGQVGAITQPGSMVSPIPSTIPPGYAPNTSPLTGPPAAANDDLKNVPKPELESLRPKVEVETEMNPIDSYWNNREPAEPTADKSAMNGFSSQVPAYTELRPIQAPEDYQSPFSRTVPGFSAGDNYLDEARSLRSPESLLDSYQNHSASTRVSVPIREATLHKDVVRTKRPSRPAQPRANNWRLPTSP